jgi:hypothetical protein
MGPVSRAALVRRQEADSKFQGAILEELQGIREILNRLSGRHALDSETVNERLEAIETRVSTIEHATRSAG